MGKRGPAGPDDEQCLKAWELSAKCWSLPEIARELEVSMSTARRWRKRGRELAADLTYDHDGLKVRALHENLRATFQLTRRMLLESVEAGIESPAAAAQALVKSFREEAEILGYAAPRRAAIDVNSTQGRPAGPTPFTVDQVEGYHRGRAAGEIEA